MSCCEATYNCCVMMYDCYGWGREYCREHKYKATIFFVLICIGTIVVGSLDADMYNKNLIYTSNDVECPVINMQPYTTITKEIWSQWNWKYSRSSSSTTNQQNQSVKVDKSADTSHLMILDYNQPHAKNYEISWLKLGARHLYNCLSDTWYHIKNVLITIQSGTKTDSYEVRQRCPTVNHDAEFFVNGHLASKSDKKSFSLTSLTYIYDCHGDTIYIAEAANYNQGLINMNGIYVSLLVKDPDHNILGYVTSFKFYSESIQIIDYNTNLLAVQMDKNFFEIPWNWNIQINDMNSSVADLRLLSLLAGQLSFSPQTGTNNTSDGCNYFFVVSSTITIVFVSIEGFIVLMVVWYYIKEIIACCMSCSGSIYDCCNNQINQYRRQPDGQPDIELQRACDSV